jgi:hypothetical protein
MMESGLSLGEVVVLDARRLVLELSIRLRVGIGALLDGVRSVRGGVGQWG